MCSGSPYKKRFFIELLTACVWLAITTHEVSAANPAATTEGERFARAQKAYDAYEFAKAVQLFNVLLSEPLKSVTVRQDARALLAFSHFFLNDEKSSEIELEKLFRENVDYPFDRDLLHYDLFRFVTDKRNAYVDRMNTKAKVVLPSTTTLGDRQPWLRALPLGVGHFANHDHLAGGLFLGTELALVAANIAASVLRYDLRSPTGAYRHGADPVPTEIVQNVAAFSLIAVVAIEILDAFVWSPSRYHPKEVAP